MRGTRRRPRRKEIKRGIRKCMGLMGIMGVVVVDFGAVDWVAVWVVAWV